MTREELGRAAYEAFRLHANTHATDETGIPGGYPPWEDLPEVCREANRVAAEAVTRAVRLADLRAVVKDQLEGEKRDAADLGQQFGYEPGDHIKEHWARAVRALEISEIVG